MSDGITRIAEELEAALCAPDWAASLTHVHNAQAALEAQGWQDIASAPKDVICLLYEPHVEGGFCFVGGLNVDGEWMNNLDLKVQRPTHWMPLPASPMDGRG